MNGGSRPALDEELSAELTSLQRRAYGPGADIHADPAAFARLEQLEASGRLVEPAPEAIGADSSLDDAEPEIESAPAPADEPEAAPIQPERPASGDNRIVGLLRRHAWWFALVLLVLFIAAASVPLLRAPKPDATLSPARGSDVSPAMLSDGGYAEYLGVADADLFVAYEDYQGLVPWVAPTETGGWALVVTAGDTLITYGVGRDEIYPVADVKVENWMVIEVGVEAAKDSLVRFTLHDGDVDVWVSPVPDES